ALGLCITLVTAGSTSIGASTASMPGTSASTRSTLPPSRAICTSASFGHQVRSRTNSVSSPTRGGALASLAASSVGSLIQSLTFCGLPVAVLHLNGCRRRRLCPKLRSRMRASRLAATAAILLTTCLAMAGCGRNEDAAGKPAPGDGAGAGRVTVEGDDRIADSLTWDRPQVMVAEDGVDEALDRAQAALEEGRLYEDADAAIPLYLAVLAREPADRTATAGLRKAQAALLEQGRAAL